MKQIVSKDWMKYGVEFLSIFIAVVSAFALNNWNENKNNRAVEHRILTEINNGLDKDLGDLKLNETGHQQGVDAISYFKRMIAKQTVAKDSFLFHYLNLNRDFVSIQNTSGYKVLQSKGLEIIRNDSLRSKIIALYEYDYITLRKLEEEYGELQFQDNYFKEINEALAPNFEFDADKKLIGIILPLKIDKQNEAIILSYFWKMNLNRNWIMKLYAEVKDHVDQAKSAIDQEIR